MQIHDQINNKDMNQVFLLLNFKYVIPRCTVFSCRIFAQKSILIVLNFDWDWKKSWIELERDFVRLFLRVFPGRTMFRLISD